MAERSEPEHALERLEAVRRSLDVDYLVERTSMLARVPTEVPLGDDTFLPPDGPKLVHYVQEVVRPELDALGYCDLIDARLNNLVVRVGSGSDDRSLLIVNYTPTQHHNLMAEPFSGKVANARVFGVDEPAVFGQGVSQNKGHQAVMLSVLKLLRTAGVSLKGTLYWAINNEGRSSHACSEAILSVLPQTPAFGVIQFATGLAIVVGNRGRVDVEVRIKGKVSHSSAPEEGLSAIDCAAEVVQRLKSLTWDDTHPTLGGRHAVVYKMRFEPLAPHTLPDTAHLTVDYRLLPGDNPTAAARHVAEALHDLAPYEVSVAPSVYMLPALVDPDDPGVIALAESHQLVTGEPAKTVYLRGTFDAGGFCRAGVPTVMYGAGGGVWPVGDDFVPVSGLTTEAAVLANLIISQLA